MLKLIFFTAFVADILIVVTSTAVATAASSGSSTATANSGSSVCGPNEHYDNCPNLCDPQKCSQLGFPPKDCQAQTSDGSCTFIPACVCNEDYLRNDEGVCIPAKQCRLSLCGPNEHYDNCPNLCVPQNCSQLGFPIDCQAQTSDRSCTSVPACVCDEDYKRNDKGVCIPIKQCPTSCGGDENAQYGCGNCPKTCKINNSTESILCAQNCSLNGCDCKTGFILDENTKKCVPPKDCTPTCGPDEYLNTCANGGCYSARTCKDLETLNGTSICVDPVECIPGCLCKEGFLRNKEGKCVPENECPESKCKGDFETYVKCTVNCMPETCDQVGFPLNCTLPPDSSCPGKPGCICRNEYVKNKLGKCIPKEQCSSCGGDPNAISSACGGHCGNRCSDYNKGPVACPSKISACQQNSCECKKGYVYDDDMKKCVLPEKCTTTCGPDEYLDACANGGCYSARTCKHLETLNGTSICVDTVNCIPGCLCNEGLLRNKEEKCVPKNDCPEISSDN